ncbi:DUF4047 domain-containing protein [Metabacillus indicus]|uniref:DUF4047 domain-containing protein n=1 Tax=Metabacillus indicus TaxID=246786 RepID=UPI003172CED6
MKGILPKLLSLSCMCCIGFYAGTQLIGETEAAFTSQTAPAPLTISAAVIFPEGVQLMETQARQIGEKMIQSYNRVPEQSEGGTLEELHGTLTELEAIEKELGAGQEELDNLYIELLSYQQQSASENGKPIDYAAKGVKAVGKIIKETEKFIDYQRIKDFQTSLVKQIKEMENQPFVQKEAAESDNETSEK